MFCSHIHSDVQLDGNIKSGQTLCLSHLKRPDQTALMVEPVGKSKTSLPCGRLRCSTALHV